VTVGTPWHERGETGRGERPSVRQRNRHAFMRLAKCGRGTGSHSPFPACRMVEAPGGEPGSEDRQHTGMGIITQPRWWSAQAQVRGGLAGHECFGHQFLR
jgi:hypothetical protein